jgi:hypothetical protein|tara:strand:- start:279 stop:461 length:183 start_codon:yes stop_codon:yes gene_type:complete
MVATENEMEDIINILLEYFPDKTILMRLMDDIWTDVGSKTYNNSLRDTVLGLKAEIDKRE